ncbi:MAG: Hsp20/alpha crystallin family protein [Acidobacteria bacterium]|jgi:HSP20 family protein|nr:MAG: Hsp20/alpha crystallin family protein [Acidobacteriota bacterium]
MRRLNPTLPSADLNLVTNDIRQLFEELERTARGSGEYSTGEYTPPLDVYETDRTFEVRMDVPGVRVDSLRVVFKHGVLIIVGAKAPVTSVPPGSATFHLVEREFGRFARAVRLTTAVDVAQARARLIEGELWVTVPKIADRRGQELQVAIEVDRRAPGASR